MASDNEASCESDPNFAVICAFMEKFGTTCGLQSIDFLELQEMLENTQEVPQELIDLHIKLLRKSRKTVSNERWEKAVIKFCHTFCVQDAWEIERFGYKKARLSSKLRVLKELLEMQFDYNARFKAEINKMSAEELRSQPLGKDKQGHAYWFQNDNNCQIRVYKEDPDEETWTLVAKDREGLASLISELSDGDSKISTESGINEDDSNSLAEKPIIDTGQVDSSSDSNKKISGDSESSNESKESTKKGDNISPQEDPQTDDEPPELKPEEPISMKRRRESDDEVTTATKHPKIEEVSEAVEEPVMIVNGEGEGNDNECVNPIVGEVIEEDLMFFYGVGDGVDCETGNDDKTSDQSKSESDETKNSDTRDASDSALVSISSDSKNCVNDEVPTSPPVKSPYKLGTIIDTKTDNKFFSTVKSPTKKSRWDVETIISKDVPESGRVKELVNKWEQINDDERESDNVPKKSMFFFGPGCLQFSPAMVGFGQKVPTENNLDKAKGDVGYRIGDGEGDNQCVQSEGHLVNEVDHQTPIETRVDKLDKEAEPAGDNVDAADVEQTKVNEEAGECRSGPTEEIETVTGNEDEERIEREEKETQIEAEREKSEQLISENENESFQEKQSVTESDGEETSEILQEPERDDGDFREILEDSRVSEEGFQETEGEVISKNEDSRLQTLEESKVSEKDLQESEGELMSKNEDSCLQEPLENPNVPENDDKGFGKNVDNRNIFETDLQETGQKQPISNEENRSFQDSLDQEVIVEKKEFIASEENRSFQEALDKEEIVENEHRDLPETLKKQEVPETSDRDIPKSLDGDVVSERLNTDSQEPDEIVSENENKSTQDGQVKTENLKRDGQVVTESLERDEQVVTESVESDAREASAEAEVRESEDKVLEIQDSLVTKTVSENENVSVQEAIEKEVVPESEEIRIEESQNIPGVTAALIGCDETTPSSGNVDVQTSVSVPVVEEICVKKHAYLLGSEKNEVVENHQSKTEDTDEEHKSEEKTGSIVEEKSESVMLKKENVDVKDVGDSIEEKNKQEMSNFDENENKQAAKMEQSTIDEETPIEKKEVEVKNEEAVESKEDPLVIEKVEEKHEEQIGESLSEIKQPLKEEIIQLADQHTSAEEVLPVEQIEAAADVKVVSKSDETLESKSVVLISESKTENDQSRKSISVEKESIVEKKEETSVTDLEKQAKKVENKKAPDKIEPVVYLKSEDKIKLDEIACKDEGKDGTANATPKKGRKNNSEPIGDDDKKPRVFTRRTTRSSKNEDEKPIEVPPPTRRGRPRANQKVGKEEPEGDSKKIKLSNDDTKTKQKEEEKEEENVKEEEVKEEASPESVDSVNATETVVLESSSSNDIVEVTEKDPLALDNKEKEEKEKPMSLSTFSLDFNESPTPLPPVTRRGLRKRSRESPQNSEEIEETGGKRQKMKAKRAVDVKLRKSIEEQKKKELISSDDDSKTEKVEKKQQKKVEEGKNEDTFLVSSDAEKEAEVTPKKNKNKNKRLLSNLGIDPDRAIEFDPGPIVGVRQSRRIAQLKIKEEAERRKLEEEIIQESHKKKKSKKSEDKDYKVEKKKPKEADDDDEEEEDSNDSKKRKKRKKKKHKLFDELNPWRSSSDSSSSNEEEEMAEEEEEEYEDVLQYVSDHEFSPESDMEGDGEALPLKRARTARKESDVEEVDDCPCQKCGKSDHPEWILLCDSCDNGWHCSCLRPPLLVIPEGDWFCPPCQHASLLKKLQEKLKDYDKKLNKKEIEDRRKQRLAYVGISLNSVLPTKDTENIKKRRLSTKEADEEEEDEDDDDDDDADDDLEDDLGGGEASSEESESGSASASETGSDSDEPIYQLRQRRQAHSYRFNDYDDLINSAIQEEMDAVKGAGNQGRGKDIATIVNAEKEEEKKKEEAETEKVEQEPLPPVVPLNDKDKEPKPLFEDEECVQVKKKIIGRKKHRKLNALDISSADDDEDSDEDFKGTSSESDDDFDEDLGSEDSEDLDSGRNRRKGNDPVRRSTRARTSRYDADFIDDRDSESEDEAPRRKKKRSIWDESESEESDHSWGRRRRKPSNRSKKTTTTTTPKKKKSKKKKKQQDSDEEVYKKKKPKIKFGLDGDDDGPVRRTRGKKINYVDALGSDSDDDRVKRAPPRIESDEDFVANEDEKVSEEDVESGEDNIQKGGKIQIQSYTDARFTQILPEPKNQFVTEDGDSELNPIDQINRNVEMMDENEMEKMMEEEEYANKQLQMVAQQLEKEKRRKEREAKKLEGVLQSPVNQLLQDPKKRPRKQKDQFQFSGSMQEPLVGNVDNLIVNSENNDELSEPPGVSLPLFAELTGDESLEDPAKKRRAKSKKTLEEAVANLGSARQHESLPPYLTISNKNHPTDLSVPAESNIEIAAPPQPFSQSQPTPSVITRMLQSKPGTPGYPVGTIRPKQFAAMPEREEDLHHQQFIQGAAGLRPQLSSPYRQMAPSMNHYPRAGPPPQIRNPVPHLYHSHRPLDPSPSGGGTINIVDHNSPGRVVSPASSSPGSNKNETPPPPYSRPPPAVSSVGGRFPMISTSAGGPRHIQMVPPSHLQPPRPNLSPYHPGMPPQYHYGQFGQEDALPPTMYQNSPYSEPFDGQVNPSENSNSKSFEDESGGEFGGLVSYFSSQREDDLES